MKKNKNSVGIIFIAIVLAFTLITSFNLYFYFNFFTPLNKGLEVWIDDSNVEEAEFGIEVSINFTIKSLYDIETPFLYHIEFYSGDDLIFVHLDSQIVGSQSQIKIISKLSTFSSHFHLKVNNGEYSVSLNNKINYDE